MTRRTPEQQLARDFQTLTGWSYTSCLRYVQRGVTALTECTSCDGEGAHQGGACTSCQGAGYVADQVERHVNGGTITAGSAELADEAVRHFEERADRERRKRERWGNGTGAERMQRLCASFHALKGKPGTAPWEPVDLFMWACGPEPSRAVIHAVRFVLAVWNETTDWCEVTREVDAVCDQVPPELSRPFDAMRAMSLWDQQHRAAFVAWAELPFWP